MKTLFAFSTTKKNLPCNKLFLYNPQYHKHIEARMLMVRKTAKQFYIRNTHYRVLASWYAYLLLSHSVARALSSALQGLTSVFGNSGLRKAPLFGERTSDEAIRERIARSDLNERSPRGRGVDPPASSTPTVDSEYSFGSPSWTLPSTEVNRK